MEKILYVEEDLKFNNFEIFRGKENENNLWIIKVIKREYFNRVDNINEDEIIKSLPYYFMPIPQERGHLFHNDKVFIANMLIISQNLKINQLFLSAYAENGNKLANENIPIIFRLASEKEILSFLSLKTTFDNSFKNWELNSIKLA